MANWWTGDFVAGDKIEMHGSGNIGKVVNGGGSTKPSPALTNNVLMLMANPLGTPALGLLEEHRSIDKAIWGARHRDRLQVVVSADARFYDLHDAAET